jgi:hypothetical protein
MKLIFTLPVEISTEEEPILVSAEEMNTYQEQYLALSPEHFAHLVEFVRRMEFNGSKAIHHGYDQHFRKFVKDSYIV